MLHQLFHIGRCPICFMQNINQIGPMVLEKKSFVWMVFTIYALVIITWLADSCRNRMLRHCPTDDRIIGGKKKGEWPLFLWEFKLLWCILCSSQSTCDICNSQFCGQQPKYALTSALLQRNTEKLSSLSLQSSYKCLDWALIKIRNAYVWHIYLISGYRFMKAFAVQSLV